MTTKFSVTFAAVLVLALAGCGREADRPSRAEAPSDMSTRSLPASYTPQAGYSSQTAAAREASAPRLDDGKPVWASNRQRSGEENAEKQFERNGRDFSASNVDDYVRKAHDFVDSPPKDALTITRSNGDVLYYDPKANIFAVADRQGAPRTMFKPKDGRSYWQEQKQRLAQGGASRNGRRSRSDSQSDSTPDESAG